MVVFRLLWILILVWLMTVQTVAQPTPSPSPSPTPVVTRDELKRSADRFKDELEKTKEEAAAALEESKKPQPKPAAPEPRRNSSSRSGRKREVIVRPEPGVVVTDQNAPGSTVTLKPTTPVVKVQSAPSPEQTAAVVLNTKKRTFWQTLWYWLPFRFFGEH